MTAEVACGVQYGVASGRWATGPEPAEHGGGDMTDAGHPAGRRCRAVTLTGVAALAASVMLAAAAGAPTTVAAVVGPDVNVTVVDAVSTPHHDVGTAVHQVTFLITNPDPQPAAITSTMTSFGNDIASATLAVPDPDDPTRHLGCTTEWADAPPHPIYGPGVWLSAVRVECLPFELAGNTSTTAVVMVTSFASAGDAPLSVPLQVRVDGDPNIDNNAAAVTVEFDGDPNTTYTPTTTPTTSTTVAKAAATVVDATSIIELPDAGVLPQTGNTPNARRTALVAVLLVVAGAGLTGLARRRARTGQPGR